MPLAKIEEAISSLFSAEQVLLGLDRDGTLMPIEHNPLESKMDSELNKVMTALTQKSGVTTAVISARSIKMLQEDFDRNKVILAGVYGLEISIPGNPLIVQEFAQNLAKDIEKLYADLIAKIGADHKIIFETDPYSLCAWFSTNTKIGQNDLAEALQELLQDVPKLELHQFPDGLEVLPRMRWDKANAMEVIADHVFSQNAGCYFYAGDASSDEPVFRWVNEREGVSVRVGNDEKETQAKYRVPDVEAMRSLLKTIC
jgi:trehalose 6-phosphate phosphatase